MILKKSFFERNTKTVAKALLGKVLSNGNVSGKIVETEAYFGESDPASHASMKSRKRSAVMFGPAGRAYVYFTYGNHWMFNAVTEKEGAAGAVLIRALEPISGIELMKKRRKKQSLLDLTTGPAKLTQALAIDNAFNAKDFSKGKLCITGSAKKPKIISTKRIGISKGKEKLLRFYIKGNEFVSRR